MTRCPSGDGFRGAVGRDNVRVMGADLAEGGVLVEVADGIATEKREGLRLCQLIPEHFEADCGIAFSFLPEHVDHLPENANRTIGPATTDFLDDLAHLILEFA